MAATEAEAALPSIAEIETAFLSAWPAFETVWDGQWVWRFANGYTKRANSMQCQDPADDHDIEARLARFCGYSREAGIRPTFRITPLAGPDLVATLDAQGWETHEASRILAMKLTADFDIADEAEIVLPADTRWFDAQCLLQSYDRRTRQTLAAIIALMPRTARGVTLRGADGAALASALTVTVGKLAMFTNVIVAEGWRGQGLGTRVMRAALAVAREAGAEAAALHVSAANAAARGLYASLGFADLGGYDYRRMPAS